ncbi:MAG: dihydropteroate synthase [Desulfatirhabdiaceae bacterium]
MLLIADNLQPLDRTISQAVINRNPLPIQNLVRLCEDAGANLIDINTGPLSRYSEQIMDFMVRAVQEATDLPVLLDTTNPKAIEAGLLANTKTAIINGISLEPAKLAHILPLAIRFQTDVIGFLLYPNGHVPTNGDGRIQVAIELHSTCQKAGLSPSHLIIDPVLVPVSWENGLVQNRAILSVIQQLPDILDFPVRTLAGLSNLTSGERNMTRKQLLECAWIPMLASSGLAMLMMNMTRRRSVEMARTCRTLLTRDIFAWEEIDKT